MIRGTTPTATVTIKNPGDLDLTTALEVFVTIRQRQRSITKTGDDLDISAASVAFWLTQEESLQLQVGDAELQINWTYLDNGGKKRGATQWLTIKIDKQLLDRVI